MERKYPKVIQSWRSKRPLLSACFRCPGTVRKPIYTTNAAEAVHRQFRKLAKTQGAFPNETGLLKLLYGGIGKTLGKWAMPIANRGQTLPQLAVCFDGRPDGIIRL
ncbi:hypothetical protein C7N83_08050 [Neisseria iguanae]|uniref:Mutator family transposase n=1 Tax=Neisseria iguanae TaxID=90242 RepID=A0A2P7TZG7_9NEIS|nr:hypothetical protein C7N83_08050 [Neisseria iguanae]